MQKMILVPKSLKEFADIFVAGKVCYISGPITGVDNYRETFCAAEEMLFVCGMIPINPAYMPEGLKYDDYFPTCYAQIDVSEQLMFLDGYGKSTGAAREAKRAKVSPKEYWAFTLKQVACYRNTLNPDWLPEGKTVADMTREFELESVVLEAWLKNVNPPKTERQKENDKVRNMLWSYQYCLKQIDAACDEIEKLDSRRKRITVQYRDVHGGGGADYTEFVIDNIQRLEREIMARTKQLQAEREKVDFWINCLKDYPVRNVLTQRYLNGKKLEDVARDLSFEYGYVRKLHGIGINQLREIMKVATPKNQKKEQKGTSKCDIV